MLSDITYIAAAVLFPLIPAYVLYRTLPARTSVKGPFKGLNIQLSGAFAGYFLLVLVVFGFVYSRPQPVVKVTPPPEVHNFEVYKVIGKISVQKSDEIPGISLSLIPPERSVKPNGTFEFEIPVRPGQLGQVEFPSVIIEHPLYQPETVELAKLPGQEQPYPTEIHNDTKTVVVTKPVDLKRKDELPFNPQTVKANAPGN